MMTRSEAQDVAEYFARQRDIRLFGQDPEKLASVYYPPLPPKMLAVDCVTVTMTPLCDPTKLRSREDVDALLESIQPRLEQLQRFVEEGRRQATNVRVEIEYIGTTA